MHRRRLLSTAGIAVAGLLAGCNGGNDSGTDGETGTSGSAKTGASTDTAEPTSSGATSATGSASGSTATATTTSELVTAGQPTTATTASTSTETTAAPPATRTAIAPTGTPRPIPDPQSTQPEGGSATVAFENGGSRVVVSGTIVGRDGCRRAVLDSTVSNDGTLVVVVGTEHEGGTNTLCTQVLTPLDYRFVLTPNDPPDSVRIVHAGPGGRRRVTAVDRSG